MLSHVRQPKTVLDSGFNALDSEFQLLDSGLFVMITGFQIPIISGIPDFVGCVSDSNSQDFGSRSKDFRIPNFGFS